MDFKDDLHAWDYIKYTHSVTRGGMIYPLEPDRKETKIQTQAINYLCAEWDYGYLERKPE